jgi:hypothetical protein
MFHRLQTAEATSSASRMTRAVIPSSSLYNVMSKGCVHSVISYASYATAGMNVVLCVQPKDAAR